MKRSAFRLVLVLAVLMALPAVPAVAASPGSPGLNDIWYPLAGNGGYRVSHYDIDLRYQPDGDRLSGTTSIHARTTQDLDRFDLDFRLRVSSVRVDGVAASFVADGGELVVTPRRPIRRGDDFTVAVDYADVPSTVPGQQSGGSWLKTPDGALASGPEAVNWWFPSNNHPGDKATFDVAVTVPDGVEAISNGTMLATVPAERGWTRWRWRSAQPQATYQAYLAIGQYDIQRSTAPDGRQVVNAYSQRLAPATAASAASSLARAPEILAALEEKLGPYPFDSVGGLVAADDPGGCGDGGNQTRPCYDQTFFQYNPAGNDVIVALGLASQWFGGSVTQQSWRDSWVADSLAFYAIWLWPGGGGATLDEYMREVYDEYPAGDPMWQAAPADLGGATDGQASFALYERGVVAVQALRLAVGDGKFFEILRTWLRERKYSVGTIADFVALSERVAGRQLGDVFGPWLFMKGKPASLPGGVTAEANPAGAVSVQVEVAETLRRFKR